MDKNNSENDDWFEETGVLNSANVRSKIKIDEILIRKTSEYQNILVFRNNLFGKCLVLDDSIQCTELDECSYQEMISFLPLNAHRDPKKVLIIGGGDGGVVREVSKHSCVEEIIQCEIDEEVVKVSKQFLQFMSKGFDSPKLKLLFQDGYEYVRQHKNRFDVIITDSSDPKGPALSLYQREYYQALYDCLKDDGIICCQAESYWFDLKFIKNLFRMVKNIFPSVAYASTNVGSYPSGQIGFLIASKKANMDFEKVKHQVNGELKYYSERMHFSAFVLPNFVQQELAML
ncbi:spermidine synthase-like protein [Sarcoptes scabiei]|nr:spermidine synthase-like protein [Sarcoptes scabiei]